MVNFCTVFWEILLDGCLVHTATHLKAVLQTMPENTATLSFPEHYTSQTSLNAKLMLLTNKAES